MYVRKNIVHSYYEYFFYCSKINLAISTLGPIFNESVGKVILINITAGDKPFTFPKGCEVTVSRHLQIKPNEIYWLKNGTIKTFQNASRLQKLPTESSNEVSYIFQNPTRQSVFEEQGIYQCVVDFAGTDGPIIGKTFNVTIRGTKCFTHFFFLKLTLDFVDSFS